MKTNQPVPSGTQDERETKQPSPSGGAREWRLRQYPGVLIWPGPDDTADTFIVFIEQMMTAYADSLTAPLREQLNEVVQKIKDCCDRDWKDESPLVVATICSNAMFWRNTEIRKLRDEKDKERTKREAAERELKDARHEASTCDDVKLDQPLVGIIAEIQAHRERVERELKQLRELCMRVITLARLCEDHAYPKPQPEFRAAWDELRAALRGKEGQQ